MIVAVLVGHGGIEPGGPHADLAKGTRDAALGGVPIAVLVGGGQGKVIVEGAGLAAPQEPRGDVSKAASGNLGGDLAALLPTARGQADRGPQRVATEQHGWPPNDLDTVHRLQRYQVEVHLLDRGLVDPHAVEEDTHALGETGDRRHEEAPERQGGLQRIPLLVLESHAGQALEQVRQDHRARRSDAGPLQDVYRTRYPGARQRLGQRPRRDHLHRGQPYHAFLARSLLIGGLSGQRSAGHHEDEEQRAPPGSQPQRPRGAHAP